MRRSQLKIETNFIDRGLAFIDPIRAERRMRSRIFLALTTAYHGASKIRRPGKEWAPSAGDADTDIIAELSDLRERSRDLVRNYPLAAGSINTKVTSVVGMGLVLKSQIDRNILGIDEEAADQWESHTEAEWRLFSESVNCDVAMTNNFTQLQELAFRSTLENGDCFVLTPSLADPKGRRPYRLQLQLIEADRICNKDNAMDDEFLSGGIKKDKAGAPLEYHILDGHPGNIHSKNNTWSVVKAYGPKTGRKNIIHLYRKLRIGQTRGVPDLAPVIEMIKQLGRYTDAEVDAAVVSAFFTVFIKSSSPGGFAPMKPETEVGGKVTDKDYKMAPAAILELNPDEDISTASPGRPNDSFDPFIKAISSLIGVALELPQQILLKEFSKSYTAARASMLDVWRFFMGRRKWLSDSMCDPVYGLFLTEAVASGRIVAPGFLTGDPLIKMAYLGSEWTGPARGQIDEKKEIDAAEKRVAMTISTLADETAGFTGGNWEQKFPQRAKEAAMIREAGLENTLKPQNQGDIDDGTNVVPDQE